MTTELRCRAGHRFTTSARPGGTTGCPVCRREDGRRTSVRVPVGAARTAGKQHPAAPGTNGETARLTAAWAAEAPAEANWRKMPMQPSDWECGKCGAELQWHSGHAALVCPGCQIIADSPGLAERAEAHAAAIERKRTGVTRVTRDQREIDLEALELARRKGIMRDQLRTIADDDRLTPDSAATVEWFAEQVKGAPNGDRLDELVTLYATQKIRRRGWFAGRPAALTAADADDGEDDDDWDDEEDQADDDDRGPGTAVALATPASIAAQQHLAQPQRATWIEALAACHWRMQPVGEWAGCQVTNANGHTCGDQQTPHHITGGWICSAHRGSLVAALAIINQARGIT